MGASSTTSPKRYIKIWVLLLGLLVISLIGPTLEIRVVTLITAFGIAIVKAAIVASEFMHLNVEKRYIAYMLGTMVLLCILFYFGTAPDIMKADGQNWSRSINVENVKGDAHP